MTDAKLEKIIEGLPPDLQRKMREFFEPENMQRMIAESLPSAVEATFTAIRKFPHDRAKQDEYVRKAAEEHAREVHNAGR